MLRGADAGGRQRRLNDRIALRPESSASVGAKAEIRRADDTAQWSGQQQNTDIATASATAITQPISIQRANTRSFFESGLELTL
jgi:hypothetical protein